ncbi:hypothetical protein DFH06DRAFT_1241364 [Mycena polygramma]|nr:hypothetical protein DFH06DRAFT_1241364 [Mycena polygramma]
MSASGDVIRAANAAAGVFPPVQSALSLVAYIDESIGLLKSNTHEIKAIGEYAKRLSEELQRINPTQTTDFVSVIQSIHRYVADVSKKSGASQYFNRRAIADQLRTYRSNLWEEYAVFSISSDANVQEFQRDTESARQAQEAATQTAFQQLSSEIQKTSICVCRLADGLGAPEHRSADPSMNTELPQSQASQTAETSQQGQNIVEQKGLCDRVGTNSGLFPANYRWFSATFNAQEFTRAAVKNILAHGIADVVGDLIDKNLLGQNDLAKLNHETNPLKQVDILFRVLDARPRDVQLVRSVQRAIVRCGGMEGVLKEGFEV